MHIITFLDVETTGLEAGSRMVELAAIRCDQGGAVIDRFCSLVNPEMPIPPDVQKIHGITDAMVKDAPVAAHALEAFLAYVQGVVVLIGHNVGYDAGVIGYDLSRVGLESGALPPTVDTCAMARVLKLTPNNKLQTLVDHFGLAPDGEAHRAARDADACRQLYQRLALLSNEPVPAPFVAPFTYCPLDILAPRLASLPALIEYGGEFGFDYVDAKGARTSRKIVPYGFAKIGDGVQFHGLDIAKGERRTFLAERVQ